MQNKDKAIVSKEKDREKLRTRRKGGQEGYKDLDRKI